MNAPLDSTHTLAVEARAAIRRDYLAALARIHDAADRWAEAVERRARS